MVRLETTELQDPVRYKILQERGYAWIRRYDGCRFERIVRNPTVGCVVELFKQQHPGCIPLESWRAQKLIRRVCYF